MGFILALAMATSVANAATFEEDKYYSIDSMSIEEVSVASEKAFDFDLLMQNRPLEALGDLDEAAIALDKVINLGKKVWDIVKANQPVMNLKIGSASALPEGLGRWDQLEGWQTPKSRVYRVIYKNLYRMRVVDFSFRVLYTYGGNLNGKGQYLTHVTVVPHNIAVAWGYRLNAETAVVTVLNAGSTTDPLAAMELHVDWGVETVLKKSRTSASFYVRGDGEFVNLTNGN